jgi:hypothetical protein
MRKFVVVPDVSRKAEDDLSKIDEIANGCIQSLSIVNLSRTSDLVDVARNLSWL